VTVNADKNYVTIAERKTKINFVHLKLYKVDQPSQSRAHNNNELTAKLGPFRPVNAQTQQDLCAQFDLKYMHAVTFKDDARELTQTIPGEIVRTIGDGACMFRALSTAITGTQNAHAQIRRIVCDYIHDNTDVLIDYHVEDANGIGENGVRYLQRTKMRNHRTYATGLELVAAAEALQIPIFVYHKRPQNDASGVSNWQRITLADTGTDIRGIYLQHLHTGEHYELISSIRDA
jgi:hypothetical protein